jgi:hypothetical protein
MSNHVNAAGYSNTLENYIPISVSGSTAIPDHIKNSVYNFSGTGQTATIDTGTLAAWNNVFKYSGSTSLSIVVKGGTIEWG